MADSTIATESVILINNWPNGEIPSLFNTQPRDGFAGAETHNVATAAYQVGSMIRHWNDGTGDGVEGWCTFMYGQNKTTAIAAALEVCQPADAAAPYAVSSTKANALIANDISGLGAVSIAAMTAAYYGWFWVEGVSPTGLDGLSAMDGDLPTDSAVIIGQACIGAGAHATKCVLEAQTAGELDMAFAWCYAADA